MPKPSNAGRERVRSLVVDEADVETRPILGNPRALVHRRLFVGRFSNDIGVKIVDGDPATLAAMPGAASLGPVERPMSGYTTVLAVPTAHKATPCAAEAYASASAVPPQQPTTKATNP